VTNLSVNPARSTGPAMFVGGWAIEQLWMFWLAPIVGAVIAGIAYPMLAGEAEPEKGKGGCGLKRRATLMHVGTVENLLGASDSGIGVAFGSRTKAHGRKPQVAQTSRSAIRSVAASTQSIENPYLQEGSETDPKAERELCVTGERRHLSKAQAGGLRHY
jgi:hypothetical protein